jgi:hypothetical protein
MPSNGATLDLVAHGVQDLYLIGNPQITYFKTVYKRHTNFSMGTILAPIDGDVNFGNRIQVTVPRDGDLMHTVLLEVDLPEITCVPGPGGHTTQGMGNIYWINNIGHGLIDHIDIYIGDQLIDTHYGEWMEIWTQLSMDEGEKRGMDAMLHRPTQQNAGPSSLALSGPLTARIPFQFWFCRNIGLALPMRALQYHDVKFDIYFAPLDRLYTFGPYDYYQGTVQSVPNNNKINVYNLPSGVSRILTTSIDSGKIIVFPDGSEYTISNVSGTGASLDPYIITVTQNITGVYGPLCEVYIKPNGVISGTPSITSARIFIDMIYLDVYELREFAQQKHRYLIEQLQYRATDSITGQTTNIRFPIKFNLPMKELFWVTQLARVSRDNDIFNFSDTVNRTTVRNDIMTKCLIQYNGVDRIPERDGAYFRLIQPNQKHTRTPNDFFYIFAFGISPEEYQPSGSSNFSKLDTVDMILSIKPGLDTIGYRCYGLCMNVLRIMDGMGGVAFSN